MNKIRIHRICHFPALLGMAIIAVTTAAHAAKPAGYLAGFATTTAIIETSGLSCLALNLYLADSPPQQAQGLMRIEWLDKYEGMLFRYREPAVITMWMKNTYIPLDMVFIRRDGRIAGIAGHTTPMSTERITSPGPVTMVLELNAGFAGEQRLKTGDRLLAVD